MDSEDASFNFTLKLDDVFRLVVVGTFHLYKGKLDSWLASIFPRLKHATNNTSNAFASAASLAAAASTPIPAMPATLSSPLHTSFAQSPSTSRVNSNQSSVTPASTTRRLTPTLLDVETFVLLCITINYIKCVQEGGADTLNRILFFTMAQRCWSPSAGLLSFWNSLLTGYAEYEVIITNDPWSPESH
ncbi:hypothetical protein BC830DRAFT_921759 [Chytriomyces sp. MP71]|nr:hypothetical protein BC830DRAFT_921759 [Chytriomyces sp. MP71]